jgi:hypothetical protein
MDREVKTCGLVISAHVCIVLKTSRLNENRKGNDRD